VAAATSDGRFSVVLGGDCSIVLGCLTGARQSARGSVGLAYFDAHADFGTPEESRTGSAASMCLALAVGRGETPLARLAGNEPLVRGRPTIKELVELLTPLVRHPRALGLELTIYDPGLDPDRSCAARLVKLLENLLLGSGLLGERSH
jgi:arginase family enzyme